MFEHFTSERTGLTANRPARFLTFGLTALIAVFTAIGSSASASAQTAQATAAATMSAAQGTAPSGTLRVGWTPPISLDPALYSDAPDESIGVAVYDYLFTVNQAEQIVPSLAKSYTVSTDGLTYILTLQSGVTFHDGSALTADDVKFTINRLTDKKLGSSAASLFSGVTAIDVLDPATIKFTLKAPSPSFIASLADYHVAILKNGTTDPTKDFNGSGPFITSADQIDATSGATFTANPNYWKGAPKIAKLQFTFNKDIASLVQALKGGQLDFVQRVPVELYSDIQSDKSLTGVDVATNLFPNIRLRADRKPGSDPNVREAFRLALDRQALNKAVYNGLAAPGYDFPIGPLYKTFYSAPANFPATDAAKAKQLIATAYPNGLSIDLYAPHGEFNSDELAQAVQQQLKAAGITVNLKVEDGGIYYGNDANNWLDADFAITGWSTRPDPQTYFTLMYRSDGIWNEAHWNDPAVDKLIDQAGQETDPAKRAAIYAQLQAIFIDHGPSFIPFFRPLLAGMSAKVSGIEVEPDPGLTSFATAVIAQ